MYKASLGRWIARINACSRGGSYRETLRLFRQMQRDGLGKTCYALPSTFRACANLVDLNAGEGLHGLVVRLSFDSDVFISSALIDMYSKCGRVECARQVFDVTRERDVVVWNSMVSGYACQGLARNALDLLMEMRCRGPGPDLLTWNALISGFSQVGDDAMALRLFRRMQIDGIEPDVFSWTSIITGFVQNLRNTEAFEVFRKMVSVGGVLPSAVTISSLLPACATVADSRRGKEMHCYALVTGIEGDLFVSSALLDMYAKCGFIVEAEKIFGKMCRKSTVSWNSMIFGYANHGYCDDAVKHFFQMEKESVMPDHLTFTAVFTACSHAGMLELGTTLFHSMLRDYKIEPRLEHYACMVDLLGRAGKLYEAYDLIKEMPLEPDLFVWGSFIGACRNHGNIDLAEIAASHLSMLESDQLGSRLLLSNLFAEAGRWGDAARIKKMLKKQMLKRSRGCSWIGAA